MHKRCDNISDADYDKYSRVPKNKVTYVCFACKCKLRENPLDKLPLAEVPFTENSSIDSNASKLDIDIEEHLADTDKWANLDKRGPHFLHLNINSLLSTIDQLRLTAKKFKAAVIGISESKLDETVLDGEVSIDGYEIKRYD